MKMYSIHLRRHGLDPDRDIWLVKEGFSWPAFFLAFLWALWHRLWLEAGVIFALNAGIGLAALMIPLDPLSHGALSLGLAAIVGTMGNDLKCRKLASQGFELAGVASGENSDSALVRFLDDKPALAAELRP